MKHRSLTSRRSDGSSGKSTATAALSRRSITKPDGRFFGESALPVKRQGQLYTSYRPGRGVRFSGDRAAEQGNDFFPHFFQSFLFGD